MITGKKGLLVASFGTSHPDARAKTITLLEEQIRDAFPGRVFYRCYTSPTVRRLMERREGIYVDGPAEALERMAGDGMEDILIFVTHVIPGIESERIVQQAEEFRAARPEIRVHLTKPLLWEEKDYRACAEILMEEYGTYLGQTDKTALIFFGHGTQHAGDACYVRLEKELRRVWGEITVTAKPPGEVWGNRSAAVGISGDVRGNQSAAVGISGDVRGNQSAAAGISGDVRGNQSAAAGISGGVRGNQSAAAGISGDVPGEQSPAAIGTSDGRSGRKMLVADGIPYDCGGDIYVVTVEGSRTAADILPQLRADGIKKALLIPFLLTAGEHVMHDMAGDEPTSAKSILRAEGICAVPVRKGLGEYERIREYYILKV